MGFFKDYGDIKRQAKEIGRNSPSSASRMAEMNQKMGALTTSLEASTVAVAAPKPTSVSGEAQLLSVEPATGYLDGNPIVTVSVLLHRPGCPPVPATQSIVVPATQVHRLQPGARFATSIDPQNIGSFALDWND